MKIRSYELRMTNAAPEWWDVYRGGDEVGHLRMGQGYLKCWLGERCIHSVDSGVNMHDDEQCARLRDEAIAALDKALADQ
jgi:hypothetical protein